MLRAFAFLNMENVIRITNLAPVWQRRAFLPGVLAVFLVVLAYFLKTERNCHT